MRFCIFLISLLCLFVDSAHGARFIGPGSPSPVHKAAEVLLAVDDSPCVLEGHLLSKIAGRNERYVFEDSSGQVIVKIKKRVFGTNTVTPQNLVRIEGEVEADSKYPNEVDAEILTVLE